MSRKVTIQDLAEQLKLTTGTVSRALNNHPRISDSTKKTVLELAEKLNYRPNRLASSLRLGKTNIIGVIIPSAEINFFGSVVHGIESLASTYGYNILLYQSNESEQYEQKAIETFTDVRVDGILASIAKNTHDFSHYLNLRNKGIPLVFFDRSQDMLNIPAVLVDDFKGGYIATEHLLKQGYKRVAHISGQQHLKIFRDRLNGYLAALQAAGITPDETLIYSGSVSIQSGKDAMEYFTGLTNPPDAIFAVEDFTALGVIKAAKEKNIRIPEQLGIIGFANESFDEHISPALSSIDQQTVQMGKEAFALLLKLMDDKKNDGLKKINVILEPLLQVRQSSMVLKSQG
ncbi:LacI family DNA-binding transcriptional regulator [Deminuibacter soli]|uniref:LacI family transcriptional regulator n=1 Tax=Deminuibacter soli TaxID=2291815 RepID=A0A3E1NKM4_9BACT|nr:LacI family DNA-binding transcriptional regulator [Deminuibacter soli]RFM28495.1 LacI family transcriptional regulator [Deminuibacter soli]